jgi:hypothetical protein
MTNSFVKPLSSGPPRKSARVRLPEVRHPLPHARPPHHPLLQLQRRPRMVQGQDPAKVRSTNRGVGSEEREEARGRALPWHPEALWTPRGLQLCDGRAGRGSAYPADHGNLDSPVRRPRARVRAGLDETMAWNWALQFVLSTRLSKVFNGAKPSGLPAQPPSSLVSPMRVRIPSGTPK